MQLSNLGQAAIGYAKRGWAVFPLAPKAKMPLISAQMNGKGFRDATTDLDQIERWWRITPNANIGVSLVHSNLVAIDVDQYKPDCEWAAFSSGVDIPDTLVQKSASGGLHYVFSAARDSNFPGKLCKGVEVKHQGYILVEPSVYGGQEYEWQTDDDPVGAPDWLFAPKTEIDTLRPISKPLSLSVADERVASYCDAAIAEELQRVRYAPEGERNNTLNTAAFSLGQFVGAGIADRAEIEGLLHEAASDAGLDAKEISATVTSGLKSGEATPRSFPMEDEPPFDPDEIQKTVDALWASFRKKEEDRRASELEWFDDIQPVIHSQYIIKGFLDQGSMSVIYGPSNSGKTFFTLDVAFHAAISNPWRERRVNGGSVLYLAAEGGNGIANRIAALREEYGCCEVPLALRRAGLDLLDPKADTDHIINLCVEVEKRGPLSLIVIDTLSRAIGGGDENAATDMTAFIRNVDSIREQTGAHILIVHHTGKDAAKGARGHSSLRAATDTEVELMMDDFGNRFAKVTKQRDHEGGEEFHFDLRSVWLGEDQDGDDVTTCIVDARSEPKPISDAAPSMEIAKEIQSAIDKAWNDGNPMSMAAQSKRSGRFAPRLLAKKFRMEQRRVQRLMEDWMDNDIIRTEVCDANTKKRGLKIHDWL